MCGSLGALSHKPQGGHRDCKASLSLPRPSPLPRLLKDGTQYTHPSSDGSTYLGLRKGWLPILKCHCTLKAHPELSVHAEWTLNNFLKSVCLQGAVGPLKRTNTVVCKTQITHGQPLYNRRAFNRQQRLLDRQDWTHVPTYMQGHTLTYDLGQQQPWGYRQFVIRKSLVPLHELGRRNLGCKRWKRRTESR